MATNKKVTRVGSANGSPAGSGLAGAQANGASVAGSMGVSGRTFAPTAEAKGRARKNRLFAALLWLLALCAEAGAVYVLMTCAKPVQTASWMWMGSLMVVDLILVIVGSSLWKKANRLDPASKADGARFFVQNQLGAIVSVIAFLPFILLALTNKDLSGKEKTILGGVAGVLMIVAGLSGADFNPPSVEEYTEQTQRVEQLTGENYVFWTKYGTKYHLYDDCRYLNGDRTDEIFNGTVAQARELKNITELCSVCETRAEKAHTHAPDTPQTETPEISPETDE